MKRFWFSLSHHSLVGVGDIGAWLAQRCYGRVERTMLAPGDVPAPPYPQPAGTSLLERLLARSDAEGWEPSTPAEGS